MMCRLSGRALLACLLPLLIGMSPTLHAQDKGCTPDRYGRMVCPAPDSTCIADRYGDIVCSTPGGGIVEDRYGDPSCGPGYCTKDQRGDVFCSNRARGAASTDRYGNAVCAGDCVAARPQACVRPKPAG